MTYQKICKNIVNSAAAAFLPLLLALPLSADCLKGDSDGDGMLDMSSRRCAYYSACLALKFNKIPTGDLKESVLWGADQLVSMAVLAKCLNNRGLVAIPAQCEWQDLEKYPEGFILVLRQPSQKPDLPSHYCFGFYQKAEKHFYIADPLLGRKVIKVSESDIKPFWDGYAILFTDEKKTAAKEARVSHA